MSGLPILLIGAGGHAASCIDVIEQQGAFAVGGLVGAPDEVGKTVLGYPVLGSDAELAALIAKFRRALIVVGQIRTPEPRVRLFSRLTELKCELPIVISPRAHVSRHAMLGPGTIVMHGAIVNARATVGSNCILNSHSLIEHDSRIGDHCHIATGAIVNGAASVGAGTFVGSQATVRQEVRIGARCVIGMGERVLADCADGTTLPVAAQ
jgi:sugar O-acyltransferase (sialic acid O-acetyltransferase NeuD family)